MDEKDTERRMEERADAEHEGGEEEEEEALLHAGTKVDDVTLHIEPFEHRKVLATSETGEETFYEEPDASLRLTAKVRQMDFFKKSLPALKGKRKERTQEKEKEVTATKKKKQQRRKAGKDASASASQEQQPQQPPQWPFMSITDKMRQAFIEVDQLLALFELVKREEYVQLQRIEKPAPSLQSLTDDLSFRFLYKQQQLRKASRLLSFAAKRFHRLVQQQKIYLADLQTLRWHWKLKSRSGQMFIDYASSFDQPMECKVSKTKKGNILLRVPPSAFNKRLLITFGNEKATSRNSLLMPDSSSHPSFFPSSLLSSASFAPISQESRGKALVAAKGRATGSILSHSLLTSAQQSHFCSLIFQKLSKDALSYPSNVQVMENKVIVEDVDTNNNDSLSLSLLTLASSSKQLTKEEEDEKEEKENEKQEQREVAVEVDIIEAGSSSPSSLEDRLNAEHVLQVILFKLERQQQQTRAKSTSFHDLVEALSISSSSASSTSSSSSSSSLTGGSASSGGSSQSTPSSSTSFDSRRAHQPKKERLLPKTIAIFKHMRFRERINRHLGLLVQKTPFMAVHWSLTDNATLSSFSVSFGDSFVTQVTLTKTMLYCETNKPIHSEEEFVHFLLLRFCNRLVTDMMLEAAVFGWNVKRHDLSLCFLPASKNATPTKRKNKQRRFLPSPPPFLTALSVQPGHNEIELALSHPHEGEEKEEAMMISKKERQPHHSHHHRQIRQSLNDVCTSSTGSCSSYPSLVRSLLMLACSQENF